MHWTMTGRRLVIFGAIAADAAIAVAKFIAAGISGSSSMLSEGIHSVIDTANSCLLLLGEKRAARPPDDNHPFGHGREIYFWSLLVAMVIFGIGGGMSTYEGIHHLLRPRQLENPTVSYWVLAISLVFSVGSFVVGIREFHRQKRPDESWWQLFRRSKDPTVYTVVFEDVAAIIGIALAFGGIFLGHRLNNPYADGIASVLIGLMMAVIACLLAWESRGLLVGESADARAVQDMCRIATEDPDVQQVNHPLTMQLGPHNVLLTLDVVFREGLGAADHAAAIDRLEQRIREKHPDVKRIFIEAQAIEREARRAGQSTR
jgi:cation diffusion facilitator family transporter